MAVPDPTYPWTCITTHYVTLSQGILLCFRGFQIWMKRQGRRIGECSASSWYVTIVSHIWYPMKYGHGFVVLCFVVVTFLFPVDSCDPFILTHWGRNQVAASFQPTFSSAFSRMKICEFRLRFHWSLFRGVHLTISQHWFRWWLGAGKATSHYMNQWWVVYWRIYASLGPNEF